MSQQDSGLDPTRHLLSAEDHDGAARRPIPLEEEAGDLRRIVAARLADEAGIDNDFRSGVVGMSKGRALAMAALLDEFAARLRPGVAVGSIRSDGSLAALAGELARDLDKYRNRSGDGYD